MLIEMFLLLTKLIHVSCSYKYRLSEILTQNPLALVWRQFYAFENNVRRDMRSI